MDLSEQKSNFQALTSHVLEYIDTRWDIFVLNASEKLLSAASEIVSGLVLALFSGIVLVFLGIGTALWLGKLMGSTAAGFFVVAGIFVVLLILAVIFARNYIRTAVTNSVLESIKDDDNNETTS